MTKRNDCAARVRAERSGKFHFSYATSAATKADAQRLLAQIPADTRNLTQRISGDPVFERSALFLKQQEAGK